MSALSKNARRRERERESARASSGRHDGDCEQHVGLRQGDTGLHPHHPSQAVHDAADHPRDDRFLSSNNVERANVFHW